MNEPVTAQQLDRCTLIDTSEKQGAYLLTLDDGAHLRVSPSAYRLLRLRADGLSVPQIVESLAEKGGTSVTAAELEAAYERIDTSIRTIEENFEPRLPGMWFRWPLLPPRLVAAGAKRLTWLFEGHRPLVILTGVIVLMGWVTFAPASGPQSVGDYSIGLAILLASLMAHEFGHAAASLRYGEEPGEIGFAMYLVFPAFYTDVTRIWRLKRWERVVVDAAGMYLQLQVGALCALFWILSGWDPARIASLAIATNCLFMLNPVFRFDGYWLLADALGVTNLSSQSGRVVDRLKARWRGEDVPDLPWPRPVAFIVTAYSCLLVFGWSMFLFILIPRLWDLLPAYPGMLFSLVSDARGAPDAITRQRLQGFVTATFLATFGVLALWRRGSRMIRKRLPSRSDPLEGGAPGSTEP